jgi:hypothetical protein
MIRKVTFRSKSFYDIPRKQWHETCSRIKRRDKFTCQRCGCGISAKLLVDHLVSMQDGGTDKDENLITFCKWCSISVKLMGWFNGGLQKVCAMAGMRSSENAKPKRHVRVPVLEESGEKSILKGKSPSNQDVFEKSVDYRAID